MDCCRGQIRERDFPRDDRKERLKEFKEREKISSDHEVWINRKLSKRRYRMNAMKEKYGKKNSFVKKKIFFKGCYGEKLEKRLSDYR